jgi:2-polyprenyl-3-methyl-5-hydroxy-6-metoxy-1,4-benzoquinol methylase
VTSGDYHYLDVNRSEMLPFIPATTRRLLDVGCGRGGFGVELRRQRPEVWLAGIEANADAAAVAATRYDSVTVGMFPADVADDSYDCIVFNDVLEHMIDPWEAVRAATGLIEPDGTIVASIPNIRYWPVLRDLALRGRLDYQDDGVLDRTHLRFFTRRSIASLFEGAGLRIDTLAPINLLELACLRKRERRALRALAAVRPEAAEDLRAQQYAAVARR